MSFQRDSSEWDYKAYRRRGGVVKPLSRREVFSRIRDINKHPFHLVYERGRYHGLGWSAGKHQDSIDYRNVGGAPPPASETDYYAMIHDAEYARAMKDYGTRNVPFRSRRLRDADLEFARRQLEHGNVISAAGVGIQGAARAVAGKLFGYKNPKRRL